MENDQVRARELCIRCGCSESMAAEHAQSVGVLDDFLAGLYSCCQVAGWADEQRGAWEAAEREDRSLPEVEPGTALVRVRARRPGPAPDPRF